MKKLMLLSSIAMIMTVSFCPSTFGQGPAPNDSNYTPAPDTAFVISATGTVHDQMLIESLQHSYDSLLSVKAEPSFIAKELPNSTGGTIGSILIILLGLLVQKFVEWDKLVKRDPNVKWQWDVWIKDNRRILVLYLCGIFVLFWAAGAMHPVVAFLTGFTGAGLDQWVKKAQGTTT